MRTVTANQQRIMNQLEYILGCTSSSPYAIPAGIFPQVTPNQCTYPPSAHRSPTTPFFRCNLPSTSFRDSGMTDADPPASEQEAINVTASQGPEPFGLHHTYNNTPLPSSAIAKDSLQPIEEILSNESGKELLVEKAGTVCQKLAREAIFGSDIMRRCTPAGSKDLPALPKAELYN